MLSRVNRHYQSSFFYQFLHFRVHFLVRTWHPSSEICFTSFRRFIQIVDCCKYLANQTPNCDIRSMVCLLTKVSINSSDVSIRTKEVISLSLKEGKASYKWKQIYQINAIHSCSRVGEHKGCNWGMQKTNGCSLELCVTILSVASSGIAPLK